MAAGGWSTDIFLESEDSLRLLECPGCLEVLRDPVMHTACGNSMCAGCIAGLSACPSCRASCSTTSWVPNRDLRNVVDSKRVYCSNLGIGCQWQGVLGSLSAHVAHECAKTLIDCPFRDKLRCDCVRVRREDAADYHYSRAGSHMAIIEARDKELVGTRAERDGLEKELAEQRPRKRAREKSAVAPSAAAPSGTGPSVASPSVAAPHAQLAHAAPVHAPIPAAPLAAALSAATCPLSTVRDACAALQRLLPREDDLQWVARALQRLIDALPAWGDSTDAAAALRKEVSASVIEFAETHECKRGELGQAERGKRETREQADRREAMFRRATLCRALLVRLRLVGSGGAGSAIAV